MDRPSSYRSFRGMPVSRASFRSRDSLSSNTSDPREKIKDCCRKLVAFMCTQVGVGGLVVGYAIVGASGFLYIERTAEKIEIKAINELRNRTAYDLCALSIRHNIFDETAWRRETYQMLQKFQKEYLLIIKDKNFDERPSHDIWTFPAALMFSLSVFTMIGYGNIVPKTILGRAMTVVYAVFGIPLYILYFMNMGKILAATFRWLYIKVYQCSVRRTDKRIIVPSTACLWVIGGYIVTGSIMFGVWEEWDSLDSVYFCVTSLCKIGLGDFVPGQNTLESEEGKQTKLIINFVYILLGMGLIAMCYNLMREEVRIRAREFRERMRQCMDDIQYQMVTFYRQ